MAMFLTGRRALAGAYGVVLDQYFAYTVPVSVITGVAELDKPMNLKKISQKKISLSLFRWGKKAVRSEGRVRAERDFCQYSDIIYTNNTDT